MAEIAGGPVVVPVVHPEAWVAPGAVVVGNVELAVGASVWFGCVLRGDLEPVRVGPRSNVQDLSLLHTSRGQPCVVGAGVSIGHRAVVHGCTVEDDCLIGMGAVLLDGCVIGAGSVVGAGAVVPEGLRVPPGSVVLGVPGRVVRPVDEALSARIRATAGYYASYVAGYRAGHWGVAPASTVG